MQEFLIDHPEHGSGVAARIMTDPRPMNWWSLRKDSGGTVRIEATRDEIQEWTNARSAREAEDSPKPPTTINIAPDPSYIKRAFEHFGIELGGALRMAPTGDFAMDTDAPDFQDVMSKLTGQLLADYATGTMVIPSNVAALRTALGAVQTAESTSRGLVRNVTQEALEDAQERLESVIGNLDGILGPVAS